MKRGRKKLGRVLIVEDDALLALALAESLRQAGAEEVRCRATIAEAIEELKATQPQILVLDVGLADRNDGWGLAELAMQLCSRPPAIIFSTGLPDAIPPEVAQLGTVLSKPYAPEQLVRAAREALVRTSLLSRVRRSFTREIAKS